MTDHKKIRELERDMEVLRVKGKNARPDEAYLIGRQYSQLNEVYKIYTGRDYGSETPREDK